MTDVSSLPEEVLRCAMEHQQAGRNDMAQALCQQLLQQAPGYAPAWHLLGLIASDSNHLSDAEKLFNEAIALDPQNPAYYKALADTFGAQGEGRHAVQAYRQALDLNNDYFEVHANLGNILLDVGRVDEALHHYQEAVRLRPDIAALHDNLGNALRISGDPESALVCHEEALRLNPNLLYAYINMGSALNELGRPEEAVNLFKQALQSAPNLPEAHYNLGNSLSDQNNLQSALTHYREAARLRPGFLEAVFGEFSVLMQQGDQGEARKCIEPYADLRDQHSSIAFAFSRLVQNDEQRRTSINDIKSALKRGAPSAEEFRKLHFRMGDLCDAVQLYDEAFEHYQKGNQLKPHPFHRDQYRWFVDQIISSFYPDGLQLLPRATNDSELPVFIVGMPRVGKTLIEQILASHPRVTGAGELPDIGQIASKIGQQTGKQFPSAIERVSADQLTIQADKYLAKRQQELFPDTIRTTDTMPGNIHYLGLINRLFPHARIIHCLRDPADTCLECYFKDFGARHPYANNLVDLGFRYSHYRRLANHWKEIGLPMLEVHYEELVQNPEETSRRLIDYLGLEWDPQCLQFHISGSSRTKDNQEFLEPINSSAVGRWRHYEQQLQPLLGTFVDINKVES